MPLLNKQKEAICDCTCPLLGAQGGGKVDTDRNSYPRGKEFGSFTRKIKILRGVPLGVGGLHLFTE